MEVDLSTCNADECGRMTSSLSEEVGHTLSAFWKVSLYVR